MEATQKLGMISRRIILVSAIVLFAGSLTAINIEHIDPAENNTSIGYIIAMFFALFLVYLAGRSLNTTSLKVVRNAANNNREHQHYRKIVKKTA